LATFNGYWLQRLTRTMKIHKSIRILVDRKMKKNQQRQIDGHLFKAGDLLKIEFHFWRLIWSKFYIWFDFWMIFSYLKKTCEPIAWKSIYLFQKYYALSM